MLEVLLAGMATVQNDGWDLLEFNPKEWQCSQGHHCWSTGVLARLESNWNWKREMSSQGFGLPVDENGDWNLISTICYSGMQLDNGLGAAPVARIG